MTSELLGALFKRRTIVDAKQETYESVPAESSADAIAPPLLRIKFAADGADATEWLRELGETPEEDVITDALTEGLAERGARPSHAPMEITPEEAARLRELAETLVKMKEQFLAEREELGGAKEELARRESELREREAVLEAEREEQRKKEEAKRNYPQPEWLTNVDGTMNVGVTGNAGVGKSLLINTIRRIRPGATGWAPVGVNETTLRPTMYVFDKERRVRLWDLPGAGTALFPLESYIQDMGLRYFDCVLIVSAGRFTSTELRLKEELERHSVPYHMVRSKVDLDVWNNQLDNGTDEAATLKLIKEDLRDSHGITNPYLVSSRDPDLYEMPNLMRNVFPGLKRQLDPNAPSFCPSAPSWNQAWAMPVAYSSIVQGVQGRWVDEYTTRYLVQGCAAHVTLPNGHTAVISMRESSGDIPSLFWCDRWFVNCIHVAQARSSRRMQWQPVCPQQDPALTWFWCD
mmetsp:Transcript_15109/g.27708  ORF Transcript_15109/g.27708 Transcript_15109/m.27708 type:complete len:463 (+) Transcript_15109:73-1461(+)